MEYSVKSGNPEKQRSSCVVVGVFESRRLSAAAAALDQASDGFISGILRRGDLDGSAGQALLLSHVPNLPCDRVLLIGCGKEREFDERAYRRAASTMAAKLGECGATEAVCYLSDLSVKGRDTAWQVREGILAVAAATYRFDQLKSKKDDKRRPLKRVTFNVAARQELAAAEENYQAARRKADEIAAQWSAEEAAFDSARRQHLLYPA